MSEHKKTVVQAFALDVDGVLTDNTLFLSASGEALKRFSFADIMGVARARRVGAIFSLISGEDSEIVKRLAAILDIEHVYVGCKDKAAVLRNFAEKTGLPLSDICFMGNDINDVAAMQIAGIAAAPADAHKSALKVAHIVTTQKGGKGAVRELLDALILDPAGRRNT